MTEQNTRTITALDADELLYASDGGTVGPWTRITEIAHEARRWMQAHSLILVDADGAYWSLNYDRGLTEEQPHEMPWRNSSSRTAEAVRVYPHEVVTVEYRTTPAAPAAN